MSTDNKVNPNDEAVNAGEAAKKALNTMRANLSMNAEEEHVGAGLMAVHMDRGLEKQLKKDKKQQRKDKSFNSMLASVEAQMAEINAQIDFHTGKMDHHKKGADAARSALEDYEKTGEFEQNPDGSLKRERAERDLKEWEKKHGKVDRDDPAAIAAAMYAIEAEHNKQYGIHKDKKEGLEDDKNDLISAQAEAERTGNPEILQEALKVTSLDELYYAADTDVQLTEKVDVEYNGRVDKGDDVATDHAVKMQVKDNSSASFLGKASSFEASGKALNVTSGFNGAAGGQMMVADIQIEQPQQIIERDNIITAEMIS